jgi:hypothetical protein
MVIAKMRHCTFAQVQEENEEDEDFRQIGDNVNLGPKNG